MDAWTVAVNRNWETMQQIQRGERRSNHVMLFRIMISDGTFARLINSGELRRSAPGHFRLHADIDTNLQDDEGDRSTGFLGSEKSYLSGGQDTGRLVQIPPP